MKDRLSFRLGDVSAFSLALLGSVEDYSGTVRQAINLLEFGFSAVLLTDHHNGEGTIRQVEVLHGALESQRLFLLPGPNQPGSWYESQRYPAATKYTGAEAALPAQIRHQREPVGSTRRLPPVVSPAMLDTIGAGIDHKPRAADQIQDSTPLPKPMPDPEPKKAEPSVSPKKPLNPELLGTIGAGIDAAPPPTKAPAALHAERLKRLSPEDQAAIAELLSGTDNLSTPERGDS